MIRLRPSGADEVLIKRVRDWYEPGPGVFIAPQALFNPALLFTTGVNGTWYDPSDLTTLYQDAAGTTPVTSVEQPVGLMLDKSSRGNHAFNSSGNSANFPVLSARYNLKTNSEFVGGLFGTFGGPVSASTLVGYSGAVAFGYDGVNIGYCYGSTDPMNIGDTYIFSAVIKMDDGGSVTCGSGSTPNTDVCVVIANVQLTTSYYSIPVALGNGYYRISATYTATSTSGNTGILKGTAQSNRTFKVTAYDLRVANDALNQPVYQRVNTATDYDTVGFKPYLKFNGTNQWLQTNSIDFSYGDKMFVCAGVRKLSDAAREVLFELSTASGSNQGTASIEAPPGAGLTAYQFRSYGTSIVDVSTGTYAAPITNVVSGIGNISAPSAALRVNGSQAAQSTATQGTGNYGNYPLYIGARAGSSLWFNGRLHQLVVAGKQASDSEIGQTEAFTNQKTGAY